METLLNEKAIITDYREVRENSITICQPLKTEDYVVQPVAEVSPPKWHLGHTTWFFETFILKPYFDSYEEFDSNYNYVFNSYYENAGARVIRTDRGNLSRPAVDEVYQYRQYVDGAMIALLEKEISPELYNLVLLGLNHEQQHQELLLADIKYILGHNPLFPAYMKATPVLMKESANETHEDISMKAGMYNIGYEGKGFCYDNELDRHQVYLPAYKISRSLVTNEEYLEFIEDGGYKDFNYWHSDGWDWVKANAVQSPLYWHNINKKWFCYTLNGLQPLNVKSPVCHVSYYEAYAFAQWMEKRLPTEFEWEAAAPQLNRGTRWEWTESAYLPYPGFKRAPGAIGEYNGKFMVNQKVLRGASELTPVGHSRISYRNFFQPPLRWQYTGIRLAE